MRSVLLTAVLCCLALAQACADPERDWPVGRLALPPGATQAEVPAGLARDLGRGLKSSSDPGNGFYMLCFNSAGDWDAAVDYVEHAVGPLGYRYDLEESLAFVPPQTLPRGLARVWLRPGGKTRVILLNLAGLSRYGKGFADGGEFLMVVATDHPQALNNAKQP